MNTLGKRTLPLILSIVVLMLIGCGDISPSVGGSATDDINPLIKEEHEEEIVCIDATGAEVNIKKRPQRTVIAYTSMLDVWYLAGGTAIGRPESKQLTNVPEAARNIEITGHVASPNVEKILSLEPDLVVLSGGMEKHRAVKDVLEQNNINTLILNYENYNEYENILDLFAKINGNEDVLSQEIPQIKQKVQAIIDKVPEDKQPKVLVLFVSGNDISCETPEAHTGTMVDILGGKNIIDEKIVSDQKRVQFSMEKVIEKDPDIVLVVTMGDMEKIENTMREQLESHEAWGSLRAIKEGNLCFLPNEYFLNKPNTTYPEAFEYLAKLLYPEVFDK